MDTFTQAGRGEPPESGGSDPSAKDKAKQAASAAAEDSRQAAGDVAGKAAQEVQDVTQEARRQASQLTHEATRHIHTVAEETSTQARDQASTQLERAGAQLGKLAEQARALADGRPDEAQQITQYVQQAGEKMAELAQRLQDGGVDGVAADTRAFARRRPGAFLLGAGVAGFAIGRVIRGAQVAKRDEKSQTDEYRSTSNVDLTAPVASPLEPAVEGGAYRTVQGSV